MKKLLPLLLSVVFININLKGQIIRTAEDFQKEKQRAIDWAIVNDVPVTFSDGEVYYEIQYLGPNNHPVFYKTYNSKAASTTEINQLYAGEELALNLSGKGIMVGVWDGGGVLASHVELKDKTTQRDNTNGTSDHATHVTGTILARGINPEAKGMAYNAKSYNYDFNGDDAEMKALASEGLILSNHSYGSVLGWNYNSSDQKWEWFGDADVSSTEDYRFGLYNQDAFVWDDIAYENQRYLIVKSAGNDRSDAGNGTRPADGPFDIIGPQACAKNILTVGAVTAINGGYKEPQSVVMSSFSSWGPTDDGRIKPDIVGMGVNVLSSGASGDEDYITLSGTSMSAPNVTGGLALLQELAVDINGNILKNFMLKGLVIHTALEAGTAEGPDYVYGWGLFSGKNAAEHLLNSTTSGDAYRILEDVINDEEKKTYNLSLADSSKVDITICWTDLPGNPINEAVLDPTDLMLVNDLDVRLINKDTKDEMYPWIIDPISKQVGKGDNFRDNVEKIQAIVPPGNYQIQVSHKGVLEVSQNYGLFVTSKELNNEEGSTFYLLGNGKGFDESGAWSLTKGGNSTVLVPSSKDVAIVSADANSPLEILVNSDIKLSSLVISGSADMTIDLNGHSIEISKNLGVFNENCLIQNGEIIITGSHRSILEFNGNADNLDLDVEGKDLIFKQSSSVNKFSNIMVNNSNVNLNNNSLEFDSMVLQNSNLFSNHAKLKGNYIDISRSSGELSIQSETNGVFKFGIAENISILTEDSEVFVDVSDFFLGNIKANGGKVHLKGYLELDSMILENIDSLKLQVGSSINISKELNIQSSSNVKIVGINGKASISSDAFNKNCLGTIDVFNVDALGSSKFVLSLTSTVENGEGWIIRNCEDVLDANFTFESVCKGGITTFYDISDGEPLSWKWDFGDINSESNVSLDQNPEHIYNDTGTYFVQLRVIDSFSDTSYFKKSVKIENGKLGKPELELVDGVLKTTAFGNGYNWYYNGEIIEGEESSSLAGDLSGGEYYIEIYNTSCVKRSPIFVLEILGSAPPNDYRVFPNPTSSKIHVSFEGNNCNYELIDIKGLTVRDGVLSNSGENLINLEGLKGVYFLRLVSYKEISLFKIIVE